MTHYPKRKHLLLAFFILFTIHVKSQKLDLVELQNFSTKTAETANSFLLTKGWEFIGAETAEDQSTVVRWEFIAEGTTEVSNLVELTTSEKQPNSIRYQFIQKEYYLAITSQFSANGYKLLQDNIVDNVVSATYISPDFSLVLNYKRENTDGKDFTSYEVKITPKSKTASQKPSLSSASDKKKEFDANGILVSEYFLKDGKKDGAITYFLPDGRIKKEAHMKAGIENGPATIYDYDSKNNKLLTKSTGTLINEKPEGVWIKNKITENAILPVEMTTYENGLKQGEFRSFRNDSIVLFHYKNDMLEGNYRVFLNSKPDLKITEIDTTQMVRVAHGFYVENKKIGLWKNFDSKGSLTEEGYLLNDAKTGVWKYYHPSTAADPNIPADFSGKLYLEESYKGTKCNGECIRYSSLKKENIPCNDNDPKKCVRYVFESFTEKSNYANDVLNGDYELKDSDNKIVKKGFYLDGKETGKWTLRNDSKIVKRSNKTTETGLFQVGMKDGKWERTDDNNQLLETYTYRDGLLHGDYYLYESDNLVQKWRFQHGNFTEYAVLDAEKNPLTSYVLADFTSDGYTCQKSEKNPDGYCVKTFIVKNPAPKDENTFTYKNDFESMPETLRILNGPYVLKTTDDKVLEEGEYAENLKTGKWTTFYYDQKVKTDFIYQNGKVTREHYFDLKKNEPFSGEFIYKEKNSEISEERKVKDGLRHGTTRFKDAKDKTIKKENYKEGVLKE